MLLFGIRLLQCVALHHQTATMCCCLASDCYNNAVRHQTATMCCCSPSVRLLRCVAILVRCSVKLRPTITPLHFNVISFIPTVQSHKDYRSIPFTMLRSFVLNMTQRCGTHDNRAAIASVRVSEQKHFVLLHALSDK